MLSEPGATGPVVSTLGDYLVQFRNGNTEIRRPATAPRRRSGREATDRARGDYLLRQTLPGTAIEAGRLASEDQMHPDTRAHLNAYLRPHELTGVDFGWDD